MLGEITGEQLRFVWRLAGGDVLKAPLQVLGPARTRTGARRRREELARWWTAREDPALLAAVRTAVRPAVWAALTATGEDGAPVRGLLAVGAPHSTLLLQRAVRESERPAWTGRSPSAADAWSLDTGGACSVHTGDAGGLVADLVQAVPRFSAAPGPTVRASAAADPVGGGRAAGTAGPGGCGDSGFRGGATTTPAERVSRLAAAGRVAEGHVVVTQSHGASAERVHARIAWIVASGADGVPRGGRLFDGEGVRDARSGGAVRVRPAGHGDLAPAVRALLA